MLTKYNSKYYNRFDDVYGVFYKNKNKWIFYTKTSYSYMMNFGSIENYLKQCRQESKKKIILKRFSRMIWDSKNKECPKYMVWENAKCAKT